MTVVRINGMKCQHCAGSVKKALEELGATEVQVDPAKGEACFSGVIDNDAMRQAIAAKGFSVVE
ncbi:heavy-metal-associated domain-containing protein [Desulfobulbus oligotrophicus]|nr:heavy-metal-associated domain-containing protein [Desulfobulbus oligotrophicus]MDY0391185.1 heavy-metal-associated domain-containing protein [Desulfobulbus oligotrophicus]